MKDKLFAALKTRKADYLEIRLDESSSSRLVYRGKRLEEAGRTASSGGCVKALVNGGWGFVSFITCRTCRISCAGSGTGQTCG
jgi:TldD protein